MLERRSSALVRIAAPLKSLVQRFTYLGLVLFAFSLMFLGKFDSVPIDRLRVEVTEVMAPILEVFFASSRHGFYAYSERSGFE